MSRALLVKKAAMLRKQMFFGLMAFKIKSSNVHRGTEVLVTVTLAIKFSGVLSLFRDLNVYFAFSTDSKPRQLSSVFKGN